MILKVCLLHGKLLPGPKYKFLSISICKERATEIDFEVGAGA